MKNSFIDFQLFAFPEPKNPAQDWQGQGKSNLLVLHNNENELEEEDKVFLQNILQAVKISPLAEQIYLCSCTASKTLPLVPLARKYQVQTVLLFGCDPRWAGIQAQLPYYSFTRLGEVHLLPAHSLVQIRQERAANKNENAGALWNALKAKFL